MANFARIEASYYQIDLMHAPVRKVLNLTYAWLFDLIGGTPTWDREYAHYFDPDKHQDFDYVELPQAPPAPGAQKRSGLQIVAASGPAPGQ